MIQNWGIENLKIFDRWYERQGTTQPDKPTSPCSSSSYSISGFCPPWNLRVSASLENGSWQWNVVMAVWLVGLKTPSAASADTVVQTLCYIPHALSLPPTQPSQYTPAVHPGLDTHLPSHLLLHRTHPSTFGDIVCGTPGESVC